MEGYGRIQFARDAARLGLTLEEAKSSVALRRRRDQLIGAHHPDRGGDAEKAAQLNAVYARMTRYLNARKLRRRAPPAESDVAAKALKANLHAGAAQISALALAAAAGFALLQKLRRK